MITRITLTMLILSFCAFISPFNSIWETVKSNAIGRASVGQLDNSDEANVKFQWVMTIFNSINPSTVLEMTILLLLIAVWYKPFFNFLKNK